MTVVDAAQQPNEHRDQVRWPRSSRPPACSEVGCSFDYFGSYVAGRNGQMNTYGCGEIRGIPKGKLKSRCDVECAMKSIL
jgi:hypothetical protein